MNPLDLILTALIIIETAFIAVNCSQGKKLSIRNKLLCRENHKLRLKLKTYEDSTKG
jgi:hypothetical protein